VDVYQSLIDARRDLVDDPVPPTHRAGDAAARFAKVPV
jgi:hypothetical protein